MNELHFILIFKPFSEPKIHVSKEKQSAWTDYSAAEKEAEELQKSLRKTKKINKGMTSSTRNNTFIHITEQRACLEV